MCQKLLQVYHCNCAKVVCTTPCPHALATATTSQPTTVSEPGTPSSAGYSPLPSPSPSNTTKFTKVQATTFPQIDSAANSDNNILSSETHSPTTPNPCTQVDETPTPNFCSYFFARYLPASNHPCLKCYMQPQYAQYRKRWVNDYRIGHPGTRPEELERLAGVEQVPESVGLVNIEMEMEKMGLGKKVEE